MRSEYASFDRNFEERRRFEKSRFMKLKDPRHDNVEWIHMALGVDQ
jgi:hypothetical protein